MTFLLSFTCSLIIVILGLYLASSHVFYTLCSAFSSRCILGVVHGKAYLVQPNREMGKPLPCAAHACRLSLSIVCISFEDYYSASSFLWEEMRFIFKGREKRSGIIHLDASVIHLAKRLSMPTFFSFIFCLILVMSLT